MHEDSTQDSKSSLLEKIQMWLYLRKALRNTKANIRHGNMMAAFYEHLASQEQDKQVHGKLMLKVGQLEESVEQEERFVSFIKNNYVGL